MRIKLLFGILGLILLIGIGVAEVRNTLDYDDALDEIRSNRVSFDFSEITNLQYAQNKECVMNDREEVYCNICYSYSYNRNNYRDCIVSYGNLGLSEERELIRNAIIGKHRIAPNNYAVYNETRNNL